MFSSVIDQQQPKYVNRSTTHTFFNLFCFLMYLEWIYGLHFLHFPPAANYFYKCQSDNLLLKRSQSSCFTPGYKNVCLHQLHKRWHFFDPYAERHQGLLAYTEVSLVTTGNKLLTSCLIVHRCTVQMMISVCISSSPSGSKVFVTVKPVVTKLSDCAPLQRRAIKCDGRIGNDITSRFEAVAHCFLTGYWWESQLFPVFPPQGCVSFGGRGLSNRERLWRWHWQTAFVFALGKKAVR